MKLKDPGPTIAEAKARGIERISVRGFERRDHEDVKSALREHFASCGRITDITIWFRQTVANIYFVGEGAADKALKLDGSVVAAGGWKVSAEPYPFSEERIDVVIIRGYDYTSLSDSEVDVAVRDFLSSCGQVIQVMAIKRKGSIVAYIKGFFAGEKAVELNGSYLKGHKVAVTVLTTPFRNRSRIRSRNL
ncbi:unnamed protein product [Microthlaspi erraticum]|uniref:RRM domain-containing protein n=1 Tax=Microthlaspi erraticum TaxID=1685480 RepID=A0A6D2KTI5_9BRAS|nr:unnamed protein product [Microthlaspi erraticum]